MGWGSGSTAGPGCGRLPRGVRTLCRPRARFTRPLTFAGNKERGWNDPPQFSYGLQTQAGGPKRTPLTKRVAAPQDGSPRGAWGPCAPPRMGGARDKLVPWAFFAEDFLRREVGAPERGPVLALFRAPYLLPR